MRKLLQSWGLAALVAVGSLFVASPALALAIITGCQDIVADRATPQYGDNNLVDNGGNRGPFGPYGWHVSYERCFDGATITKHVEINFQFDAALGFIAQQMADYRTAAERNIEGIWNHAGAAVMDLTDGRLYGVAVDITTAGPFNQTVQVHTTAAQPREDMLNWNDTTTAAAMSHELGHMLGLFDEYIGGAVNQFPNPLLSNDGLMGLGALNVNPVMYPRYYQQYADFMNELNHGFGDFVLVIPLPATWLLLVGALALLSFQRRRR